jgi:hypothetical protein
MISVTGITQLQPTCQDCSKLKGFQDNRQTCCVPGSHPLIAEGELHASLGVVSWCKQLPSCSLLLEARALCASRPAAGENCGLDVSHPATDHIDLSCLAEQRLVTQAHELDRRDSVSALQLQRRPRQGAMEPASIQLFRLLLLACNLQ